MKRVDIFPRFAWIFPLNVSTKLFTWHKRQDTLNTLIPRNFFLDESAVIARHDTSENWVSVVTEYVPRLDERFGRTCSERNKGSRKNGKARSRDEKFTKRRFRKYILPISFPNELQTKKFVLRLTVKHSLLYYRGTYK